MSETKTVRLSKLARELNVGISTMVEFLKKKGYTLNPDPNSKVTPEEYDLLQKEFSTEKTIKKESEKLHLRTMPKGQVSVTINDIQKEESELTETEEAEEGIRIKDVTTGRVHPLETSTESLKKKIEEPKVLGKIDLEKIEKKKPVKEEEPALPVSGKEKGIPEEKVTPVQPEEKIAPLKGKKKKEPEPVVEEIPTIVPEPEIKVVGKIDIDKISKPAGKAAKEKAPEEVPAEAETTVEKEPVVQETPVAETMEVLPAEEEVEAEAPEEDENFIRPKVEKLAGPNIVGKMDLSKLEKEKKKPVASSSDVFERRKKKRKRIKKEETPTEAEQKNRELQEIDAYLGKKTARKSTIRPSPARPEIDDEDVQRQIKDTLARLTAKGKSKASRYRREKREELRLKEIADLEKQEAESKILRVTEFVTVNELASLMNVPVVDVIQVCMNLGLIVSINQRLDAEHLALVADEFNYKVEFVVPSVEELVEEEEDDPSQLVPRPPIVTVMGHVDHGKTKLLDYIRKTNVIAGEAGGITQHIGAYSVTLEDGRMITFLDTPGHEAFTAMRARGASITDVAIIVIAADDGVMPQTVEAINHAQAAGVPMVFAINKIDKPTANPEKIKEELAKMNLLVEDWGGKYQSQEISAKEGKNVDLLLEKVLLEAELLDLKANPNKRAKGTVIESALDKGRGYVATVLVADGTLRPGDLLLAGHHYGHVKALFNERGKRIDQAGPSMPAVILGLNGAPQAGEKFVVMTDEREVKEIATRREQLQREQGMRTQKHITLDEIGRRIAIGNFKELNIIVKGDVDGSVEALSDSLIKLSTPQVQVNVIHKAVGQISESDILLAAASNAIIVGFQVRPSFSARKLAEKEQIDIRLYSIIYDAINEIKDAIAGMLSPEMKEEILGTAEVLETFKVSKVGTVAGCIVREGKIVRNSRVRVIRDGIVVYTGELASLKRYKEDVKEVTNGMECGLGIQNFNDVKVGDMIEAFSETEVKPVL
jgi:translation initiation factor IF-2